MSLKRLNSPGTVSVLLVGPFDPHCGEYTFLAPPLGVWRLKGVLQSAGVRAEVFDPNCCDDSPTAAFDAVLSQERWDVVGVSTTGMTLRYDLALAHQARRRLPDAILIAGGMEATFKPQLMFDTGPFDLVALGEGERPLLALVEQLREGRDLHGIAGTAELTSTGKLERHLQVALDPDELRDAIFSTPYEEMPYRRYWEKLEAAYRVGTLPVKADREARLAEIRSVRLNTLNYCPMGCSFCSSTNFLHAAQGGTARIRRLGADDCLAMVRRIVAAHPDVRTVIFQDDIFVFTSDDRILPLCEAIVAAKGRGELPRDLQFISTNRIDAMTPERLEAMRAAGFRVLGFGIESFAPAILEEFNKARIAPYVRPNLSAALELGITPFLDLILTSPRCTMESLGETIRNAYHWLLAGCEMGMYPYVIPFSGAPMAADASLEEHTVYVSYPIAGTDRELRQAAKILPVDPAVRAAILKIETEFEGWLQFLQDEVAHLPSRVRSLVWIICGARILAEYRQNVPDRAEVVEQLLRRLPGLDALGQARVSRFARRAAVPIRQPRAARIAV
jgi:radical SAM superfamily enzyme YgiQ (UPF0313 family)